jgi:hypothetical protein
MVKKTTKEWADEAEPLLYNELIKLMPDYYADPPFPEKKGEVSILGDAFTYSITHAPYPGNFRKFRVTFTHKETGASDSTYGVEADKIAHNIATGVVHQLAIKKVVEWA